MSERVYLTGTLPVTDDLKKSPWEHAFEVCSSWKSETFLWQDAFWSLVREIGIDRFKELIEEKKSSMGRPIHIFTVVAYKVHESHWAGLINRPSSSP